MAKLVQHDTGEDRTDQDQRPGRGSTAPAEVTLIANKCQQQEKRHVQAKTDPEHAPDWNRPTHPIPLARSAKNTIINPFARGRLDAGNTTGPRISAAVIDHARAARAPAGAGLAAAARPD